MMGNQVDFTHTDTFYSNDVSENLSGHAPLSDFAVAVWACDKFGCVILAG
jgi:hypothetical protein